MSGGISSGLGTGGPIWPKGPEAAKNIDKASGSHRDVTGETTRSSAADKIGSETLSPTTTKEVKKTATKISTLSLSDITKQLAKIGIPINKLNEELAFLMAAHGVEISEDSFALMNKLLKGKKSKSAQESAVLLISKGLGNDDGSLDILNNLLNNNSLISKSLNELIQLQGKMTSLLNSLIKDNPSLQAFIATFEDFNDQLKKLKNTSKDNLLLSNQKGLVDDLLTMEAFLKGLGSKFNIKNNLLSKFINELGELNKNLFGQIILSQDSIKQPLGLLESYHYFQLPNPLSAQAVIEMLLRKHSRKNQKKDAEIIDDKNQEKIIIKLDTESMGTITVIVIVMGLKVWCTIYTDNESTINHAVAFRNELSNSLKKYQYNLEEFKSIRKKINLKKFIAPSQDISEVKRIETEI